MRKTLQLFALLIAAFCMIGCGEDNGIENKPNTPENPENPEDPTDKPSTKPEISITEVELTFNSYTFEITTNMPAEYGYVCEKDGFEVPPFYEWFTRNSGEVTDKATVTLDNLNDNTTYKLCIVLRSKADGTYSAPKMITFTTPDDGEVNPIIVENTTYESITFTINLTGRYIFIVVSQDELTFYGQTAEAYLEKINSVGVDPYTYEWYNGGMYLDRQMVVHPDRLYYIVAAQCDSQNNIIGKTYQTTCNTPKKPAATGGVETELSNIGSTAVTIKTTPTSNIPEYYVYVKEVAWTESIINGYGESMLSTLIKRAATTEDPSVIHAWKLTTANEQEWGDLVPNTAYDCLVLAVDDRGGETLSRKEFTTTGASSTAPEVDLSITAPAENSHMALNVNIYSATASTVRVAFMPTADVEALRKEGDTDLKIVVDNGTTLSSDQAAAISSTGLSLLYTDLWYNTEYTAIVSVKNSEQLETLATASFSTTARPVPARVESELFTTLLGEWEVSYDFVDYSYMKQRIEGKVVTIAQGVDTTSEADYRAQNQLVILGWPFQIDDFVGGGYTYFDINDLMAANSYWANNPSLAYRDYGPKIFLEIAAGDVVTVPTALNTYLYNDAPNGGYKLNFFGCHYNEGEESYTAPATFPVTVSDDGDTLVIGAHHSGEEFGFGIYRPAVFRGTTEPRCIATSDIILKRVK